MIILLAAITFSITMNLLLDYFGFSEFIVTIPTEYKNLKMNKLKWRVGVLLFPLVEVPIVFFLVKDNLDHIISDLNNFTGLGFFVGFIVFWHVLVWFRVGVYGYTRRYWYKAVLIHRQKRRKCQERGSGCAAETICNLRSEKAE